MPKLPNFQVFFGVDFSGARKAGRNTWIARVEPRGKTRRLALASLDRVESLCGTAERAECLAALVELVRASDAALWGFNFPFGMPVELFPEAMPWAEQFAFLGEWGEEAYDCGLECVRRATELFQRKHIRRTTDDVARAPFDPYHYRMRSEFPNPSGASPLRLAMHLSQHYSPCIPVDDPWSDALPCSPTTDFDTLRVLSSGVTSPAVRRTGARNPGLPQAEP
jgi:hypothetical protein